MNKVNKCVQSWKEELISVAGSIGESLGLNRTVCQIYALLYFSPEPLSPADVARQLKISKANVSVSLRKLEDWNAVVRVWRKGYARSLYLANGEVEKIVVDKLKSGLRKRLTLLRTTVGLIARQLPRKCSHTDVEMIRRRIRELKELLKKIEFLLEKLL